MNAQAKVTTAPISLRTANFLVRWLHRHHGPVKFHLFSIGAYADDHLVGAAIVFRPANTRLDDGHTLEVSRCTTDGTPNACSALYGAAARAAFKAGYSRIVTYTQAGEPGTSLLAAGWAPTPVGRGSAWKRKGFPERPRVATMRWERQANTRSL